ncbi:MAG TPA: polyprenyl synthetase family protein [Clostridia bacterium]|nr:polyprenyl synthetase family protein [Clostridia bacterium]
MYDIEKITNEYLPKAEDNEALIAAKYALESGGKRLRPNFILACAEMINNIDDKIKRMAAAIEYLHTYSLIHDDLPSMDNDDTRRGKPSCHIAFGEATAILAGDALQSLAFETLTDVESANEYYLKAINYIAKMSGSNGMIYGQCLDGKKTFDQEQYLKMIKLKTANMFMASIVAPAIYFGIEKEQIELLESFAQNYGVLFQIADDFSDNDGWVSQNHQIATKIADNAYKEAVRCLNEIHYDTKFFSIALENIHSKMI